MCFLIEVDIPTIPRQQAGSCTREINGRPGLLHLAAKRQKKDARASRYLVCEPEQGCACSLLADDADWDQPFFSLTPEGARSLAATLRVLGERSGERGFTFRCQWVEGLWDEEGPGAREMPLAALLRELARARIPATLHAHLLPVAGAFEP